MPSRTGLSPSSRSRRSARSRKGPNEIASPSMGRVSAATGVAQHFQKLFRRDEIGGLETLGKAVVNRTEAGDGVGVATLITQQPGEARRGAQLPGQRALVAKFPIQSAIGHAAKARAQHSDSA